VSLEPDLLAPKGETTTTPSSTTTRTEGPELIQGAEDKVLTTPLPYPGPALRSLVQSKSSNQLTLIPLSVSQLQRDLAEIRTDMLAATNGLLETIGNVCGATMPLCPRASLSALELQVKCWGPQWSAVRSELVTSHLFPASEVLMSLCSAFLLTIFDRECSAYTDFRSRLGSGAYDQAIASLLEESKWPIT
jgi:hypothetical protein